MSRTEHGAGLLESVLALALLAGSTVVVLPLLAKSKGQGLSGDDAQLCQSAVAAKLNEYVGGRSVLLSEARERPAVEGSPSTSGLRLLAPPRSNLGAPPEADVTDPLGVEAARARLDQSHHLGFHYAKLRYNTAFLTGGRNVACEGLSQAYILSNSSEEVRRVGLRECAGGERPISADPAAVDRAETPFCQTPEDRFLESRLPGFKLYVRLERVTPYALPAVGEGGPPTGLQQLVSDRCPDASAAGAFGDLPLYDFDQAGDAIRVVVTGVIDPGALGMRTYRGQVLPDWAVRGGGGGTRLSGNIPLENFVCTASAILRAPSYPFRYAAQKVPYTYNPSYTPPPGLSDPAALDPERLSIELQMSVGASHLPLHIYSVARGGLEASRDRENVFPTRVFAQALVLAPSGPGPRAAANRIDSPAPPGSGYSSVLRPDDPYASFWVHPRNVSAYFLNRDGNDFVVYRLGLCGGVPLDCRRGGAGRGFSDRGRYGWVAEQRFRFPARGVHHLGLHVDLLRGHLYGVVLDYRYTSGELLEADPRSLNHIASAGATRAGTFSLVRISGPGGSSLADSSFANHTELGPAQLDILWFDPQDPAAWDTSTGRRRVPEPFQPFARLIQYEALLDPIVRRHASGGALNPVTIPLFPPYFRLAGDAVGGSPPALHRSVVPFGFMTSPDFSSAHWLARIANDWSGRVPQDPRSLRMVLKSPMVSHEFFVRPTEEPAAEIAPRAVEAVRSLEVRAGRGLRLVETSLGTSPTFEVQIREEQLRFLGGLSP